ncbi:MAG TPA: hypothetical protein VNH46_07570 [Gemmatimonadales bacterium]|nr:hypothetical protein [Gemmatimonadales bacterium]
MRMMRVVVPLVLLGVAAPVSATTVGVTDLARAYVAAHTVAGHMVPSYARQTGLACSACHYQFLALTPFGRRFKLNGYTMTGKPSIVDRDSASNGGKLGLEPFSLLSAMLTAGVTHVKQQPAGTQNDVAYLPQELSGFIAGRITPKIGLFSQFTYAQADGGFGIDNIDVRFANKGTIGSGTEVVYGLTLNNNPTVQDLWNTTPAWGFPFIGSDAAPAPAAGTMIDGGLEQNVLGLGGYAMFADMFYAEVSAYRSALQGVSAPDASTGAIKGVAPYWRLAFEKDLDNQSITVGTFGMVTSVFPDQVSGPRDRYSDVGVDAQFESKVGTGNLVVRGSWIHEKQTLDASFAGGGSSNATNTLKTLRANASYYPKQWLGVQGGYFDTRGTADANLYGGLPNTNGFVGELDLNPWENTRVGLQYTGYSKFDGTGTNASDNNTLFAFLWMAF